MNDASEIRAAAERRRAHDWITNRVYERMDEEDADGRVLADAYLAEHPADDADPAGREWMESHGWAYLDAGVYLLKLADGYVNNAEGEYWFHGLQLNTVGRTVQIVADAGRDIESVELPVACRTRGDIRRLHAVFRPAT